jgi:hypothetical protein
MSRDSLYGERILWQGRCQGVSIPFAQKAMAGGSAVVAAVTLCYAVVVSKSLDVPVGGMVGFRRLVRRSRLRAWRVPVWWRSQVEYSVTERHVIWQRGRIRRSIESRQISYALIRWSTRFLRLGDLVLVRAVPTGALRRTLSLTLHDVSAPDRLWALIRGVEPSAPLGNGDDPSRSASIPGSESFGRPPRSRRRGPVGARRRRAIGGLLASHVRPLDAPWRPFLAAFFVCTH